MADGHSDTALQTGSTDHVNSVAARQRRANRWMVAVVAVLVAVPVVATVEQVVAHGPAFFTCRGPAVGATSHRAPDCPKP
jgi:hypothetical protein